MSTDEEQIEALKRWWKENGTSSLIGVALVLVGFFGYRQWDSSSTNHSAAASDLYQQVAELVVLTAASDLSEEDVSTVTYLNDQLQNDFSDTVYSRYSALFMAKILVEKNDLSGAEAQLSWIIDNPGLGLMKQVDKGLLLTARGRLARVILAQGEAQRALDLLQTIDVGEFSANFAEIEGDAYLSLGQKDQAKLAYQRAVDAGNTSTLLSLKLDDLGS